METILPLLALVSIGYIIAGFINPKFVPKSTGRFNTMRTTIPIFILVVVIGAGLNGAMDGANKKQAEIEQATKAKTEEPKLAEVKSKEEKPLTAEEQAIKSERELQTIAEYQCKQLVEKNTAKVKWPWVEISYHYLVDNLYRYVDMQAEILQAGVMGNAVITCAYNEEDVQISNVRAGKINPTDGKYSWDGVKEIQNKFGLEREFFNKIPNKEAQVPFLTCTPAIEKALGKVEWKLPANVNFQFTNNGFKLEVQGKVNGNDVMVICDSVEETQTVTTRVLSK